ncbi:hypothetical protein C5167_036547, partial [Papaver somniferum]
MRWWCLGVQGTEERVKPKKCLAQATEYGFSGTSLKQTSWGNLCKFFSEKYDCTITQKKLRNHWDYLRTQYVTWSRLLARTGHGYNAETNTFDWSEEKWIELDKTIKNTSQFKNKGLEDAEKLQNLFDGKFSTGANRDTPGRVEPPCSAGTSTTAGVSNNGSESRTSHGKEKTNMDDNEVDSSLNAKGSGRKRKKEMEEESSDLLTEKVFSIVTSMKTHLQNKKLALEKDSAAEFVKALDNLLETDCITMDEYLIISLKASDMPGWQKLFVSLKSDERRVAFIEWLQGRGFTEGENLNTGKYSFSYIVKKLKKTKRRVRPKYKKSILTGKAFTQDLLDGNSRNMYNLLRMSKVPFTLLCNEFRAKGLLEDSKYIEVEENMAIFLYTIGHNCRNRPAITKRHKRLREGAFKGVVGALDGTLISASIPVEKQTPYRGMVKGECTQNVLAICTAHDSRVLIEAVRDPSFKFPLPPP